MAAQSSESGGRAVCEIGRPQCERPAPAHALSQAERARVLAVANGSRFATVPSADLLLPNILKTQRPACLSGLNAAIKESEMADECHFAKK